MPVDAEKLSAKTKIAALIAKFQLNEADYLSATYNETQARTDFITPFLQAFGWDVHNDNGLPMAFREVIEEATVDVGEEKLSKRPDYELRLARQRKFFLEAKKPNVRIDQRREPAFQTRRYGYSASLPISVLTNFHHVAVYDCRSIPQPTDEAHVARLLLIPFAQLEASFDELWPLISRKAVYSGAFDQRFAVEATGHGRQQFDQFFLSQVRSWRERLAVDTHANTPGLTPAEITYAVQLFLSRIVFLRICEDREIEVYETLKNLPAANTFDALMAELRRADDFYNSGLFRLLDDEPLHIRVSDDVLLSILRELYYPQSPYTFAVVETEVLGEIYEQFLGEEITVTGNQVHIVYRPEVRESGGVVPTPRYIVDAIVARTMLPALAGKSPADLAQFTVADICCGSGVFLLSAYEFLLDHHINWYLANDRAAHVGHQIYEVTGGQWRLTFEEKRRILLANVRGVDIDTNAVEVARFSLLLKLIEGETGAGLRDYVTHRHAPALPALDEIVRGGNSLVSQAEWTSVQGPMTTPLVDAVNPFTWSTEFPAETQRGGFDVIVGNPPYIRIQNMTTYSPAEVAYYQSPLSPYTTGHQDNFDKYALFIERSLSLIKPQGRLGVIVPNKFMTIQSGRALRSLLTTPVVLEEVVHFGIKQVFGNNISNYTCILVITREGRQSVRVETMQSLKLWRYGHSASTQIIEATALGSGAWQLASTDARELFARVLAVHPERLGHVAEIFVGVQTSADSIYIFVGVAEQPDTVTVCWNGQSWHIERGILRPALMDAPLPAYGRPAANTWMIFPYTFDAVTGRAHLIQPDTMASQFPGALAYLTARRAELDRRSVAGGPANEQQFYQFGRSQSLTKFNSPKIILPILSTEARYAYDDVNVMVTGGGNGPYYMVRPRVGGVLSNYYLLAVLNHPLSEAMVRSNTSTFRGGYYSHGKQFIEHLPVPLPSDVQRIEIEGLVQQLIDTLATVASSRVPHQKTVRERQAATLRLQIENAVGGLFGLTVADMEVVTAVPVPA